MARYANFFIILHIISKKNNKIIDMKLIRYRGGIVSFKLPANWKEEYYDDGGAAFYRDELDSGTLRLSVISFERKEGNAIGSDGLALLSDSDLYVNEGFRLKEETKLSDEDGEALLMYFWYIHVPTVDNEHRLIIFSYTILASQESDLIINEELNFIRNTILSAHYSQDKGIIV